MSFAQRLRKLASETAIYGIASILGRAVGFLIVPFYTQFFNPDEYGIVLVVYAGFVVFNIIYTYGMEAAYLKFASGSEGRPQASTVFSTATWTLVTTSVLFSLVLLLFKAPIGRILSLDSTWFYLLNYVALILVLDTLVVVPFAELRLANRPIRFAFIRVTGIVVNIVLNVVLIWGLGWNIEAVFISNVISSALVLVMMLPVYVTRFRFAFDRPLWKELMRFGLPFLPSGLGYAATEAVSRIYLGYMSRDRVIALYGNQIDLDNLAQKAAAAGEQARLLAEQAGIGDPAEMARLVTEATNGVYGSYVVGVFGAVYKLAALMLLFAQMFRFAWQPFFLQHAEDEDARPLFARIFTLFTAGALFVFLGVNFFIQELVAFPLPRGGHLIAPAYWMGLGVIPILLFAYVFQGWYYNFSAGLYIEKRTEYFMLCTLLGGLVTLVLNIVFVPTYGIYAAAWATFAAYMVMALALFIITHRIYPIRYEWHRVAGVLVLAGVLFGSWYMMEAWQVWWVEILLLMGFVGGIFALRIVPLHVLTKRTFRVPEPD